jgi:hypothetical protein
VLIPETKARQKQMREQRLAVNTGVEAQRADNLREIVPSTESLPKEVELPDISKRPKKITKKEIKQLARQATTSVKPDDIFESRFFLNASSQHTTSGTTDVDDVEVGEGLTCDAVDAAAAGAGKTAKATESAVKRKITSFTALYRKRQLQQQDAELTESEEDEDDDNSSSEDVSKNVQPLKQNPTAAYMQKLSKAINTGALIRKHESASSTQARSGKKGVKKAHSAVTSKTIRHQLLQINEADGTAVDSEDEDILPAFLNDDTNNGEDND